MFSRRHYGFSLIEMVIAIVIIGVGIAGVISAFNTTVKSSADPMVHKQMLAIAEEMMEEILLKPYSQPVGLAGTIPLLGCNRADADDVSDYDTYSNKPVCDIGGTQVGGLTTYKVSVTVVAGTLGLPAVGAKKVTVTVNYGSESLKLVGWRTDYASP